MRRLRNITTSQYENYETLDLFVTIYNADSVIQNITKSDVDKTVERAVKFFRNAIYKDYVNEIEESSEIFDLAQTLANVPEVKEYLTRVNIFLLTNGEVKLFLPKQDISEDSKEVETFDIDSAEGICERKIDKETRKIIKNLSKDQERIDFLIQDNELKSIYIPDTAIYTFPDFKKDPNAQNLDETNADLALRCSNFLPVEADNYELFIIKTSDDNYVAITDCKVGGMISVRVQESLELSTGGNLIF
jgi:hypothetical protein